MTFYKPTGTVNVYPDFINKEYFLDWLNVFHQIDPESKSWQILIRLYEKDPIDGACGVAKFNNNNVRVHLNFTDPRHLKVLFHELLHKSMSKYSKRGAGIFDYSMVDLHHLTKKSLRNFYQSFEDWFIELTIWDFLHKIKDNHDLMKIFYGDSYNNFLQDLDMYDITNLKDGDFIFYPEQQVFELIHFSQIPPYTMWSLYHTTYTREIVGYSGKNKIRNLTEIEQKLIKVLKQYSDLSMLNEQYYRNLYCDYINTTTNYFFGYDIVRPNKSKIQLLELFGLRFKGLDQSLRENN